MANVRTVLGVQARALRRGALARCTLGAIEAIVATKGESAIVRWERRSFSSEEVMMEA